MSLSCTFHPSYRLARCLASNLPKAAALIRPLRSRAAASLMSPGASSRTARSAPTPNPLAVGLIPSALDQDPSRSIKIHLFLQTLVSFSCSLQAVKSSQSPTCLRRLPLSPTCAHALLRRPSRRLDSYGVRQTIPRSQPVPTRRVLQWTSSITLLRRPLAIPDTAPEYGEHGMT